MAQSEPRPNQRVAAQIPIRVLGFTAATLKFSEDTHTTAVSPAGAFITLKMPVTPDDVIRIINQENHSEADFRIVGPTRFEGAAVAEWGVECIERGRNVWGLKLPAQSSTPDGSEVGPLLECGSCHKQGAWPVTLMETEVLDSTGAITRTCGQCARITHWAYGDATRRPRDFGRSAPLAPPPQVPEKGWTQERTSRRVSIKLPTLVRSQGGEDEVSETQVVSKNGIALYLALELKVDDTVTVLCPYTPGGQNIEQKANVRYRSPFSFGERWLYGLRYLR